MTRRRSLRIGFIPLLDAAIVIAAARLGFAERRGLTLDLARETSWATIRDRLAIGHLDAAHLLAPMPVAAALGLAPIESPLIAPMALGSGGNAITFSADLWARVKAVGGGEARGVPRALGMALAAALRGLPRRPVLAVVHPYSAHNYELRYWLAASGVRPDEDVAIAVLPPSLMPAALADGGIDGCCVGEPWNSVAAREAGGEIVLPTCAIWRSSPEKALGVRASWAEANAETLDVLLDALLDAADWCGDAANRADLVALLAAPEHIGVDAELLAPALDGRLAPAGEFISFRDGFANFPWRGHAEWFLRQMARWGQAEASPDAIARARAAFRPDLMRAALGRRGLSAPADDDRPETPRLSFTLAPGTRGDIRLPALGFFDDA